MSLISMDGMVDGKRDGKERWFPSSLMKTDSKYELSRFLLNRLSGVLRAAARLVLQLPRICHITDAMKEQLHWLDIPARVDFKLCILAFRCLRGSAPPYLSRCCISAVPGRPGLRSATTAKGKLIVPNTNTKTISRRAFAISCPLAWNSLPDELRDISLSFLDFRKKLKTFLF